MVSMNKINNILCQYVFDIKLKLSHKIEILRSKITILY